jgi:hypothetical protein
MTMNPTQAAAMNAQTPSGKQQQAAAEASGFRYDDTYLYIERGTYTLLGADGKPTGEKGDWVRGYVRNTGTVMSEAARPGPQQYGGERTANSTMNLVRVTPAFAERYRQGLEAWPQFPDTSPGKIEGIPIPGQPYVPRSSDLMTTTDPRLVPLANLGELVKGVVSTVNSIPALVTQLLGGKPAGT